MPFTDMLFVNSLGHLVLLYPVAAQRISGPKAKFWRGILLAPAEQESYVPEAVVQNEFRAH